MSQSFDSLMDDAASLERTHPLAARFHLLMAPMIIIGMAVLLLAFGVLGRFSAAALASFVLGKLIILKGALPSNAFSLSAWQMASMVMFLDIWVGYVLCFQMHRVYRIPKLGPWLADLQDVGRYWIHKNPWVRRFAFLGVALFVVIPLTGTGAAGGSILGRLVGLRPWTTLLAIATGAVAGCSLLALFAVPLGPVFRELDERGWLTIGGLGIVFLVVGGLFLAGTKLSRAAKKYAADEARDR